MRKRKIVTAFSAGDFLAGAMVLGMIPGGMDKSMPQIRLRLRR